MTTSRARRAVTGFVVVLAVALPLAPAAGRDCFEPVAGIGDACRVPGGYVMRLPDGLQLFTHGFDPVPGVPQAGEGKPNKPVCVTSPDRVFHHELLYVRPSGTPDRYERFEDEIRDMASIANGIVRENAKLFDRQVELQFACDEDGVVEVHEVVLDIGPAELFDFQDLVSAVREKGYFSWLAKYWIWLDGELPGAGTGVAGIGASRRDDRLVPENRNNVGPQFAAVWGVGADQAGGSLFLHEASHMMGAVNDSAPNSTKGGHCTDGRDVMCYPDAGRRAGKYDESRCRVVQYDCGHDDYFHPDPPKKSYLNDHWNIGSPFNRFVVGCAYRTGIVTAGSVPVEGVSTVVHSLPKRCAGTRFALSAVPALGNYHSGRELIEYGEVQGFGLFRDDDDLPTDSEDRERLHEPGPLPDADVCFRKRNGTELACFGELGTDTGIVPDGARRAVITLKAGAQALYVLNTI